MGRNGKEEAGELEKTLKLLKPRKGVKRKADNSS